MKILFFFLFLFLSMQQANAIEIYPFSSPEQQQRFVTLTSQLRCLVCQNQNLAESNAPLANDLRDEIYQKVKNGESDKKIIDYLVDRYGNFILYRPPLTLSTSALWLGPLLLLIFALGYLIFYIQSMRVKS